MDMAAMNEMSRASAPKCLLGESEWKPAEKRRRRRGRRRRRRRGRGSPKQPKPTVAGTGSGTTGDQTESNRHGAAVFNSQQ